MKPASIEPTSSQGSGMPSTRSAETIATLQSLWHEGEFPIIGKGEFYGQEVTVFTQGCVAPSKFTREMITNCLADSAFEMELYKKDGPSGNLNHKFVSIETISGEGKLLETISRHVIPDYFTKADEERLELTLRTILVNGMSEFSPSKYPPINIPSLLNIANSVIHDMGRHDLDVINLGYQPEELKVATRFTDEFETFKMNLTQPTGFERFMLINDLHASLSEGYVSPDAIDAIISGLITFGFEDTKGNKFKIYLEKSQYNDPESGTRYITTLVEAMYQVREETGIQQNKRTSYVVLGNNKVKREFANGDLVAFLDIKSPEEHVRHEMTHVEFYSAYGMSPSHIIMEGLAQLIEGPSPKMEIVLLNAINYFLAIGKNSYEFIENTYGRGEDSKYELGILLMKYLESEYGIEKVLELCKILSSNQGSLFNPKTGARVMEQGRYASTTTEDSFIEAGLRAVGIIKPAEEYGQFKRKMYSYYTPMQQILRKLEELFKKLHKSS